MNLKAIIIHTLEAAVILAAAFLVTHIFGSDSETKAWALATAMAAVAKLVREFGEDYVNE